MFQDVPEDVIEALVGAYTRQAIVLEMLLAMNDDNTHGNLDASCVKYSLRCLMSFFFNTGVRRGEW